VDLAKFNTLRNLTAAHASVANIRAKTSAESRAISQAEVVDAGSTLLHILCTSAKLNYAFGRNS
jgi:hypothetical protein